MFGLAFAAGWLQAAPYSGETFAYRQPDGEIIQVRLHGDEFFAYQETEDGYLVVRDPKSGFFCYAKVTPNGSDIVSTGVRVGQSKPAGLNPKQRLAPGMAMKKSLGNRNLLEKDEKGRRNVGKKLIQEPSGEIRNVSPDGASEGSGDPGVTIAPAPPPAPTLNKRVGLVLLASFPDRPGDITKTVADIDNYCNAETYTAGGNATSIYGYFQIQSNGKLDYKNNVTAWFTAANNRDYYTTNTVSYGTRARDLIREGLAALKAQGFDFTKCDGNGDGRLDGVNIFYAGSRVNAWSEGLWPHQSSSSWTGLSGTGLTTNNYDYQITDMPASPPIGTFCHENGHMICDFPDLYSYDGNAANIGSFSLMANSGSTHPRHVDPYLKIHAGWADVVDLTSTSNLQCSVQQDRNFFYRYRNPARTTEYFLFEVRGTAGYEGVWNGAAATNPANGLVIYHASQTGTNTSSTIFTRANPPTTTLDYTKPYELMVMEATPSTLANGDPWYTDPNPSSNDSFSSAGVSSISDSTTPDLKFWASNGRTTASGANINTISAAGGTMTFKVGSASLPVTPVTNVTSTQLGPKVDYGQNAASQTFAVFNSAGGTLSYSITDNVSWLSCAPASGSVTTSASTITVTYATSSLAAGTYSATITVDGGSGGIKTIPVTLTVYAQPTLTSFPSSISTSGYAGLSSNTANFYVGNSGGGTASYSITKTQSWLSLNRTSGTVASEQDLITATLNATSLSPGVYTDTITVTSSTATNSPLTIAVTFTVLSADMIVTSPNGGEQWVKGETRSITWISSLGGNVKIELFKAGVFNSTIVANTPNDGAFDWTISGGQAVASDYTVKITSIETPAKTDSSNANFSILPSLGEAMDTSGLTWTTSGNLPWLPQIVNTHDGVDVAQSGAIGDSQSSSVETTLTGPGTVTFWWNVSSESNYDFLRFYLNGAEQAGAVAMSGTTGTWAQKTISIPTGSQTIKWTYSKDGSVVAGSDAAWVDQVVFTPAAASEIAVEQPVGTDLTDGSATIDCGSISLGSSSSPITVTVKNTGTANLTGLALSKSGTHEADFALGSLGAATLVPGASTTFDVTFSPGAAGGRTAAIQIASNDANENPFDINLTGTGVPLGTLSVTAGNFSASGNYGGPFAPLSKVYTLNNIGSTPINWTASKTAAWMTLDSISGTLAGGANTTVTVSFDANALPVGGYSDTVSFTNTTNSNGDTSRSIDLTVNPFPVTTNLGNLLQTYDGAPKPVTVSTTPGGKAYSVAYTPSGVPVNAGSYPVTVTITEPNHSGSASGSLTISKASQTINFAALPPVLDNAGSVALGATATSGLSVSYASSNPLVATISGSTLNIVGLGTTTITASQAGDSNYNAAAAVPQTFTVVRSNPLAVTGGPYKVLIGQSLSLDGSASLPTYNQTISTYEWDLNNDNNFTDATGTTPVAIPFATLTGSWGMVLGLNTIQLKVTDSASNTSTVSTTVELILSLTWDANGTTAGQTNGASAWLGTNQWWDGTANQNWVSGSDATFGGPSTAGGAVTLASPTIVNALNFNVFSGTYNLGTAGQSITLKGGITKNSESGAVTLTSPIILGGPQTWTNHSASTLASAGGLNNGGFNLTIDGSGGTNLNQAILSGSGGIVKNGSGLLILGSNPAAAHNYSGPTTLNDGVTMVGGNLPGGNLTLDGGVLENYSGGTFNRALGTGTNQVRLVGGASGFSEYGSGTNIELGGGTAEVQWGSTHFKPSTLVLMSANAQSSSSSNASVNFKNAIDLNGATRTVAVNQIPTVGVAANGGTLSGVIRTASGTAGLSKTGVGTLRLTNAANTYNGATTIDAGILDATTFAAINTNSSIGKGSPGGSVADLVLNGGTLRHSAANIATTNRLFSIGTSGGGIDSSAASATNTLSFTATGAFGFIGTGTRTLTLGGSNIGNNTMAVLIGDDGGANPTVLTKSGLGTWMLTNASNSYTGLTTVSAGLLVVTKSNALGGSGTGTLATTGGLVLASGVTTNSGESITISSGAADFFGALRAGTGGGTWAGTVNLDASARVGAAAAQTLTITGSIVNGAGSTLAVSGESGTGVVVLNPSTSNTYTGNTNLIRGILRLGKTDGLSTSTTLDVDSASSTSEAATFDMAGFDQSVAALQDSATTSINGKLTNSVTGTSTLTVNQSVNTHFAGVIEDGGPGKLIALVKSNAGTLTLAGPNIYTGATAVTSGTLALGADNVLPNATAVSISAAILNAATYSDVLGSLDVTAAATINLGSGAALAFADSSAIDWTGGTLILTGTFVPGSSLRFGTSNAGLTSVQLAKISVAGFSQLFLDANGYLTVDNTPPTLVSITDDPSGGPVVVNTVVTYTLTFSEDINAATVTTVDFGNAGTAAGTIGTITETTPGVFTVQVLPTSPGTLQLRINAGAVLNDVVGNSLNTSSAILDDTTITVMPLNSAPVAVDQNVATAEDTDLPITLVGTDADLDVLSYTIVSAPTSGTLSGMPPNLTYTPASNFHGSASFTFKVNDSKVDSATATVSITVTPVNDAPVFAANPITGIATTEDTAYSRTLAGSASDVDAGTTLAYAKVSGPAWLLVAADGTLSGTPDNSHVGANSFAVSVSDGIAPAVEAILNITVINTNDAPVFAANPITGGAATEDMSYSGTLAGSASDVDVGAALAYAKVSGPTWLLVATDGTLSGTPDNSHVGANNFTVSVSDGIAPAVETTLNITVIAGPPDFTAYISDPAFGLAAADQDFADDSDGDKLPNGLEAWFGSHPGESNIGLIGLATNDIVSTFTHPHNLDAPVDLTGYYEWSPNLVDWYAGDGVASPPGGPTVVITSATVGATTTVTATASGAMNQIFLHAKVRRN